MSVKSFILKRRCYSTRSPFALNIDTVPLAFQKFLSPVENNNNPIVFLHGLCGNKKNNRASARILSQKLESNVYNIDLRNHGDSPHTSRHDTAAMASDVENFIIENNLQKPVIIGHSMGAKTALAVALRRPEMPSLIISVDNIPYANVEAAEEFSRFKKCLKSLDKISTRDCTSMAQLDYMMSQVEPSRLVRTFMLSNLHREKGQKSIHSKIPSKILINHLEDIRGWEFGQDHKWVGPALLIKAKQSPFVHDIKPFKTQFPNGVVQEIDCGHWIITEENEKFNKICIDFLSSL